MTATDRQVQATIFCNVICALGEGCLWHPKRQSVFWCDIFGQAVHEHGASGAHTWHCDRLVGALAWADRDHLVVSVEKGLVLLNLNTGEQDVLCTVEPGMSDRRANDGRADHQGGFWFSMMDTGHQSGLASIYRYYRGEVRRLHMGLTVPNVICFSPDGLWAYFGDTRTCTVYRQNLDGTTGWPLGDPERFLHFDAPQRRPDGATMDADGIVWIAMWGEGLVEGFGPDGHSRGRVTIGTPNASCACLGGLNLSDMIVTSATTGIDTQMDRRAGMTFIAADVAQGVAEPRLILG